MYVLRGLGAFTGNVTYQYSSRVQPVEMRSGSPVLHAGDTITAYITGATPGGEVRRHQWLRNPYGSQQIETVLGRVAADGSFTYTYTVPGQTGQQMYGSGFSVDSWMLPGAAGAYSGEFDYLVGEPSAEQIASSPFTTPPEQLPVTSPYSPHYVGATTGGSVTAGSGLPGGGALLLPAGSNPPVSGFSLGDIPWWGWLAGAGVAVMAFKGRF